MTSRKKKKNDDQPEILSDFKASMRAKATQAVAVEIDGERHVWTVVPDDDITFMDLFATWLAATAEEPAPPGTTQAMWRAFLTDESLEEWDQIIEARKGRIPLRSSEMAKIVLDAVSKRMGWNVEKSSSSAD